MNDAFVIVTAFFTFWGVLIAVNLCNQSPVQDQSEHGANAHVDDRGERRFRRSNGVRSNGLSRQTDDLMVGGIGSVFAVGAYGQTINPTSGMPNIGSVRNSVSFQ